MKELTIKVDPQDGALLHARWKLRTTVVVGQHVSEIEGPWAEDLSPFKVHVPHQLAGLLVGLQNRLADAYEAAKNPQLFYIRSYKHDQHNVGGDERALWWCPGQSGYTHDLRNAGKYGEAEAKEICGPGNATLVGQGPLARLERNNLMYPVEVVEPLVALMVSRFDLPKHVEVPA